MEADGAVVMWQRSIEEHKLRYTSVIADGDAKTYKAICDGKPYRSDVEIVKHECVGHVQKRMMNHLKALKQSNPVDSDGRRVRIAGQNWITDVVMKRYERYYGKAIRSHTNDPEGMKKAVWEIFLSLCQQIQTHSTIFVQRGSCPGVSISVQCGKM